MTTARTYVDPDLLSIGRLVLEGEEHHHLSRVLRIRKGQPVSILDGQGSVGRAAIIEVASTKTVVEIEGIHRIEEERPRLHLFQALPRGAKMDHVVQWGVELGAATIEPFSSRRSRPLDEAVERRIERWRKIAVESSRVAGRSYLPYIRRPLYWQEALEALRDPEVVLIADEAGGKRPAEALKDLMPEDLGLIIGPEGGFTDTERKDLRGLGAIPVTLGDTILRTETAGLVLLAAVRCHYKMI